MNIKQYRYFIPVMEYVNTNWAILKLSQFFKLNSLWPSSYASKPHLKILVNNGSGNGLYL